MGKNIIVIFVTLLFFLFFQLASLGIAKDCDVTSTLDDRVLFFCSTSDMQLFLSRYENSALNKFLNEPAPKSFIAPAIQQINRLVSFWLEHFQLTAPRLRQLIKDKFALSIVMVTSTPLLGVPRPVTLISFRPDSSAIAKWLQQFQKRLPEDVDRSVLTINDIRLTSLHYYIKTPVKNTQLFKYHSSEKRDKTILPDVYREYELYINYGFHKGYFLLAIGEPSRVKKALSEPALITAMCPSSPPTKSPAPSLQIMANLKTLNKAKIIKGKFFRQAIIIFNVTKAKLVCLPYPNELRLNMTFLRAGEEKTSAHIPRRKEALFRYSSMMPDDADYFLIATINWADAWHWFDKNVAHLSRKFQRNQKAVLENLSKNSKTLLGEFFAKALGQEVALFPLQIKSEDTQTSYNQLMLFIELKEHNYFSSMLRRVLRIVAQITYFELSEEDLNSGRLFILKEQRPTTQETREVVFWVGKEFALVSGRTEAIASLLHQPRSGLSLYEKIPLLKQFTLKPVFILSWRSFNLSALLSEINTTAKTLKVDLQNFNKEVLNIDQYIPSSLFNTYFSHAHLFIITQPEKTEMVFQLCYK
ncbi:hypothetical protein J7M23_09500 [Candidatus Sumerlaeota bacterium]|nr:hypothetical protein [Candidatus Sumerlaeota bacterium]